MKNRLLPLLLVFLCSLCFALPFIAFFMNARDINCTRQANQTYTCQFKTLYFGRYQISDRTVENITDIVTREGSCDENGCGYRAEFVSSDGKREPLSSIYTDQNTVTQQVDAIGSQMDAGLEQITYHSDPPWWILFLIGGLTLMAMLLIPRLLSKGKSDKKVVRADRSPNRLG